MFSSVFGWFKTRLGAREENSFDTNLKFNEEIRRSLPDFNTTFVVNDSSFGYRENVGNMDVELRGKMPDKIDQEEKMTVSAAYQPGELGDVEPDEKVLSRPSVSKETPGDRLKRKKSPSNTELTVTEKLIQDVEYDKKEKESEKSNQNPATDAMELMDVDLPFRMVAHRSSHQDLKNLLDQCPEPQAPLTHKHLRTMQLNENQAFVIADQVTKMKTGLARLQEIVTKFDCANKFKQDIDFLVENVGNAIVSSEEDVLKSEEDSVKTD